VDIRELASGREDDVRETVEIDGGEGVLMSRVAAREREFRFGRFAFVGRGFSDRARKREQARTRQRHRLCVGRGRKRQVGRGRL
jgi:hypothetical protein